MAKLETREERNAMRIIVAVLGGVFLFVWLAASIATGVWLYNWYSAGTGGAHWVIHVAVWLLLLGFLQGIAGCIRNIAGYQKKWVYWTKWED